MSASKFETACCAGPPCTRRRKSEPPSSTTSAAAETALPGPWHGRRGGLGGYRLEEAAAETDLTQQVSAQLDALGRQARSQATSPHGPRPLSECNCKQLWREACALDPAANGAGADRAAHAAAAPAPAADATAGAASIVLRGGAVRQGHRHGAALALGRQARLGLWAGAWGRQQLRRHGSQRA